MEISPKIPQILKRLLLKTKAGKVQWEVTNDDNAYQVSYPNSSIQIAERTRKKLNHETRTYETMIDYFLLLFNDEGVLVDEYSDIDLKEIMYKAYEIMRELFILGRRYAHGSEQVMDEVLADLLPEPDEDEEVEENE